MTYQIVSERRKSNPGAIKMPNDAYELIKRYRNAPKEQLTIVHHREVFVRATGYGDRVYRLPQPPVRFP